MKKDSSILVAVLLVAFFLYFDWPRSHVFGMPRTHINITHRSKKTQYKTNIELLKQTAQSQNTLFVDQNANGKQDGSSWQNACHSLSDAISSS